MKRYTLKNVHGFTLIELMIVIAIIGILAAIAMPNYVSYRDKAFCSAAESDVNSLADALADYFAIPINQKFALQTTPAAPANVMTFPGSATHRLSGNNTGTISPIGITNQFRISVTDLSGRCPINYQNGSPRWSGVTFGTYVLTL